MLNECIDGNHEESREKPKHPQQAGYSPKTQPVAEKRQGESSETNRADRNESVFDLLSGKVSRRETAHSDTNCKGRLQIAFLNWAGMEKVVAVKENVGLQQRGEKPEIRIAEHGQEKHPIRTNVSDLLEEIAERVQSKCLARVGRRHTPDAEAGPQTDNREADQNDAGPGL